MLGSAGEVNGGTARAGRGAEHSHWIEGREKLDGCLQELRLGEELKTGAQVLVPKAQFHPVKLISNHYQLCPHPIPLLNIHQWRRIPHTSPLLSWQCCGQEVVSPC